MNMNNQLVVLELVGYTKPRYLESNNLTGFPMVRYRDEAYCVPLFTNTNLIGGQPTMPTFKVFDTKEKAKQHAIRKYGKLELDTQCVNVIKIGPQIAKHLRCNEGYAIDKEIEESEE